MWLIKTFSMYLAHTGALIWLTLLSPGVIVAWLLPILSPSLAPDPIFYGAWFILNIAYYALIFKIMTWLTPTPKK